MKAEKLEVDDTVKVDFTHSVCTVVDISYKYGRISIGLSYYENGLMHYTTISKDTEVILLT